MFFSILAGNDFSDSIIITLSLSKLWGLDMASRRSRKRTEKSEKGVVLRFKEGAEELCTVLALRECSDCDLRVDAFASQGLAGRAIVVVPAKIKARRGYWRLVIGSTPIDIRRASLFQKPKPATIANL